jgi:hypothetical protein
MSRKINSLFLLKPLVFTANCDIFRYSSQLIVYVYYFSVSLVIFISNLTIVYRLVVIINWYSYCSVSFNLVVFKYSEFTLIALK